MSVLACTRTLIRRSSESPILIYSRRKREGTTSPAVSTSWEKQNESPDAFAQVCKICYSLVSETQLSYGIKIIARDQQHHRATSKPVVKIDGLSRWSRRASSRISPVDDVSKEINALRRGAVRPMDVTSKENRVEGGEWMSIRDESRLPLERNSNRQT